MSKNFFYSLILIQSQIGIIKENIDILHKRYNEASVNFKNGLKTEFDLLSAEVDYEDLKLDLENKTLTPSFSIGLLLDPDFQQNPLTNSWFGDYNYMNDNNWKYQRAAFSMTVALPISSFFPFGAEQMNIVRSQYNVETLKVGNQKTRENLEIQIKKLVKDLKKDINTINAYKQNLALAQRAYDMAEESYKVGTMLLLDVQVQENKLENAKFNLLNTEYSYTSSLLDIENILNTNLH